MRKPLLILGRTVSVAVLSATLLMSGCTREGEIGQVQTSPNGRYTASIRGNLKAPKSMFVQHSVKAEVIRAPSGSISVIKLYDGDSRDSAFSELYDQADWIRESTIRFRSRREGRDKLPAELIVENRSEERLEWMQVSAQDLFVILDLLPGARVTIPTSGHPPADLIFVKAEARSGSNQRPLYSSTDFRLADSAAGWTGRYIVVVENDRITLALDPPLQKVS